MNKKMVCVVLSALLVLGSSFQTLATSVGDVQKQQTETKNKLSEVNKSITAIENKRKEVQSQISNLNSELVDTMLTLELLEADLEAKKADIEEAQAEYELFKQLEEEQYAAMKLRIQYMYEKGGNDYIGMLLSAESISDLLNRAGFVQDVADYDDEKLTEYQETKERVAETKATLEEEQAELEEVQEAQELYKKELDKKIATARSKVKNFETELANAQAKAKEYQNTIKQQNALITKLQEEEKKRLEAENNTESTEEVSDTTTAGGTTATTTSSGNKTPTMSGSGTGASIASYALQFVGNPYVSGGTSLTNGADCSGFTWAVHKHFGISIPRRSVDQANAGKAVSISAVQPGDIIYYGNHVGIYIGNGQIVHASTQKTGIKISNYTYRTPICVRRYW